MSAVLLPAKIFKNYNLYHTSFYYQINVYLMKKYAYFEGGNAVSNRININAFCAIM